ncbi:serine/threonine-protein kinase [Streptomyces sp. WMMC500]|uniref:serine/threonine-protein kinase n=1 Tax=Streptomyces sp. WMMC500 TaxID=3015154 RepID=UPI00248B003E|nr:serine/threonine-protein kinase [Streptomyces sp. WMMC500]WBB62022.1 serine/threonine-protein kinase [Streptomyces sp. WMMC500]
MKSMGRIGRYRLERRLGAGAFCVVWLAYDDVLEAPVAVKVLAENWAHRLDIRERFLVEARLLRRADSNRVVQVFDIGELPDDRPYFVMEYADGGTLEDRLAEGPLSVQEALHLTAQAALAAAALHAAGVVHRDIKPSNVLFRTSFRDDRPDNEGTVRVLLADLGLAKSLANASGLTLAAGSAGYQPPEQAVPGAGIDERADVYSLGALGYHLLTGCVPGPPGQVVRPDEQRPGLHADVRAALRRAMEPDRERRWRTAREFADELGRLALPAEVRPAARPRRRSRGALLAIACAAVIAAGGVGWWQLGQPSTDTVQIEDSTGRIAAEVPAQWGRQIRTSGWHPQAFGLGKGVQPGIAVADDLSAWQDPDAAVNGLFVGLSERGDVAAMVRTLTHHDCRYKGNRIYQGADWQGGIRSWDQCPNESGAVIEIALAPAESGGHPQVYLQIRQSDGSEGSDATDRILDSLRIER